MTETNCSGCKKPMTLIIKSIKNDKKTFYKTCEFCRKKQKERYDEKKKEFDEEVKEECYICFNELEKGIRGIECIQCKKSCCGNCYIKICISSKDCFKCGICRFQEYSKPYEGNLEQMKAMIQKRAISRGYSYKLSWKWTSYAI